MKQANALCCLMFLAGGAWAGTVEPPLQIGGAFSVPTTSLRELRFRSTIRQQFDFSCGSAAIATLLAHHYRHGVNEQTVFEGMYRHGDQEKIKREGFSLLDMKRYLQTLGFEANGFEATLEMLGRANIPAIALIQEQGYHHFIVIKGLRQGRVLIGDPSGGLRAMSQASFQQIWTNQILFVINNQQDRARFNLDAEWKIVPRAPTDLAINRNGLGSMLLPKLGPGDF
ncbi:C39 family peptidase [Roseateles sp. DAIF2]|uniref:C39 family peptidase n=1 Tax=Roseateles sp. DAIF2 TaxID=2714952 RepID=UPI0018A289A6|nr:C39 family peptidase [Roseateles sp. DAIF2]QPF73655.1 C39 family peptidase [Roseateles sp. DAIF2]